MGDMVKRFILIVAGVLLLLGIALAVFSALSGKKDNENEGLNVTTEAATFVSATESTTEVLDQSPGEADSGNKKEAASDSGNIDEEVSDSENINEGALDSENVNEADLDSDSINEAGANQTGSVEGDITDDTQVSDAADAEDIGNDTNASSGGTKVSTTYTNLFDGRNVTDSSAPVFLILNKKPTVYKGEVFNVHDFIGYGDDVDRNVDMEVTGFVDTDEVGTHTISVTLTDDAGHTTSASLNVNVVEGSSGGDVAGNTGINYEPFESFSSNYKETGTSLGIDVSRWQGDIDYEKVKASGVDFVIMRIGGYDDGSHYTDRCYKANIQNARAAGLKIGIYWHAEESTEEEVKQSVKYMMDVLGGEKLDFPIAYDWEDFAHFEDYGMSMYDLNDCYQVFAGECSKYGYNTCLYSSMNFLNNTWSLSGAALGTDIPVWLAHYTSNTSYQGKYFMWQHSSTGYVDGINGPVDLNVLYLNEYSPSTNE